MRPAELIRFEAHIDIQLLTYTVEADTDLGNPRRHPNAIIDMLPSRTLPDRNVPFYFNSTVYIAGGVFQEMILARHLSGDIDLCCWIYKTCWTFVCISGLLRFHAKKRLMLHDKLPAFCFIGSLDFNQNIRASCNVSFANLGLSILHCWLFS